jgi:SnoaL-like polyketide cyclase
MSVRADLVFAADCIVHIVGVPEPLLRVADWKDFVAAVLVAIPALCITMERQFAARDIVALSRHRHLPRAEGTGVSRFDSKALITPRVANGRVVERWEYRDHP